MSSSVASMTIVTSGALPNVLPHYRIRENPNISQSEWEWLRSMHKKTEVCMCVCVCVCMCVCVCALQYVMNIVNLGSTYQ